MIDLQFYGEYGGSDLTPGGKMPPPYAFMVLPFTPPRLLPRHHSIQRRKPISIGDWEFRSIISPLPQQHIH
jgi:hypothetical protein